MSNTAEQPDKLSVGEWALFVVLVILDLFLLALLWTYYYYLWPVLHPEEYRKLHSKEVEQNDVMERIE